MITEKETENFQQTDNTSIVITNLSKEQKSKQIEKVQFFYFQLPIKTTENSNKELTEIPAIQPKTNQNLSPIGTCSKIESKSSITVHPNVDTSIGHPSNIGSNPEIDFIIEKTTPPLKNFDNLKKIFCDFSPNHSKSTRLETNYKHGQKKQDTNLKRSSEKIVKKKNTKKRFICSDQKINFVNNYAVNTDTSQADSNEESIIQTEDRTIETVKSVKSTDTIHDLSIKTNSLNRFKVLFAGFMLKEYFQSNKNLTIIEKLKEIDKFNKFHFKDILKIKLEKTILFIEGHINNENSSTKKNLVFTMIKHLIMISHVFLKDKNFDYEDINKTFAIQEILSFFSEIKTGHFNCKNIAFIEFIKSIIEQITIKSRKNDMISIQELNIEIEKLDEKKPISLTDENCKIIKKVVINIIKKNDGIIKKNFPDIYDWLSLEDSIFHNSIQSKHYDLYEYFITLFILKKLLKSPNEFLDNPIQSNNNLTLNEEDTFDKQKNILIIRYNFLRVIFPLIEQNIFLNYIELFFYMSMSMSISKIKKKQLNI